jgi:SPP1 gp7 family putative phage head morphogenesis protein
VLNPDVILENLASQFYKISVRRYGADARMRIRTALNDGLAQGKSFQDMARGLKKAMDTTYANAIRIIRTEGQTAIQAGADDAYAWARRKGIEMDIIWDATLDGKTRPDHGAADGQVRGRDGMFNVGGEEAPYPAWQGLTAGQRINCRCRIRAQIAGYGPQLRRTREQGIIPYQTYTEWRNSRSLRGK